MEQTPPEEQWLEAGLLSSRRYFFTKPRASARGFFVWAGRNLLLRRKLTVAEPVRRRYINAMTLRTVLIRLSLVLGVAIPVASQAAAEPCHSEEFEGTNYTICSFDLRTTDLRIFWRDNKGTPYRSFSNLASDLDANGMVLEFAMNGGMFDADYGPIGLFIEKGTELKKANTAAGPGNFHMKPNGVFYVNGTDAGVLTTEAFLKQKPRAEFATQSGPMLVIDGKIHQRFIIGSDSLKRRNGVGVSGPHTVHFAISEGVVNFYDFARLFRDHLGCDNALFLDGSVSSLYANDMGRNDAWHWLGPIIGVVNGG